MDIDKAMTAANEIRRRATAMKDGFEEERPGKRRNATAMKDGFEEERPGKRRNATATTSALMRCRLAADSIETMCDDLVIQLWAYQQADARGRRMDKIVQSTQKAARTGMDEGRRKEPKESKEPEEFDDDKEEDAWDDL